MTAKRPAALILELLYQSSAAALSKLSGGSINLSCQHKTIPARWQLSSPASQPQQQQQKMQEHLSPSFRISHKKLRPQEVNDHMLVVPGVLSVQEAQQLIDAAEACGFEHQSSRGPAFGEAFRYGLGCQRKQTQSAQANTAVVSFSLLLLLMMQGQPPHQHARPQPG
jgi:hypothetical protein